MKYTLITDLHLKHDNLEKVGQLFDMVEEIGYPVINLGDTFDTKELIRGKCLNFIHNRILNSKLHWYLLIGNHDFFSNDSVFNEHSLEVLKELENVTVMDERWGVDHDIGALPYTSNIDYLKMMVEDAFDEPILLLHQGINTFDVNNGYIKDDGIEPSMFKDFKLVISGHYHKHQVKGNVMYLGTAFSHDFSETNQDKYIGILDTGTCEVELIKMDFPQHFTGIINCTTPTNDNEIKALCEMMFDPKDYNRVILEGKTKENIQLYAKTIQNFFPKFKIIEKQQVCLVKSVVNENEDNLTKWSKWATNEKKLSKETIKLGIHYLKKE